MTTEADINATMLAIRRAMVQADPSVAGYWQIVAGAAINASTAELEAKIARVREIHKPYVMPSRKQGEPEKQYCEGCGEDSLDEYPVRWPCATIRALDDTDTVLARRKREERKAAMRASKSRAKQEALTQAAYAKDGINVTFVDRFEDA